MKLAGKVVRPSRDRWRPVVVASLVLVVSILVSLSATSSEAGAEEVTGSVTPTETGTARTFTFSSPGDHATLSVPVTAGESVSMIASEASVSGTYRLDWLNPKGEYVRTWNPSGEAGGFFEPIRFAEAGTATLLVDPEGTATGSITFTLYDASDRTGSISTAGGGETKTFTIGAPGQRQLVHFQGTEGQHVSLVPTNAGLEGEFHVNTPAGEWLEGSGGTLEAMHGPLALPETGTYTVVLTGDGAQTGSIALGAFPVEVLTGSVTPTETGTARTFTFSSPGDHATLSVPVTAGESVSMIASEASVSGTYRLDWLNPKGEYVRTWNPSGEAGGFFEPIRFAEAGTATLLVDPEGTATGSITFTLYDASDRTGSISTAGGGETKTFTIGAPGQRQLVHFQGTEGQHVSLVPTNAGLEGEFHVNTPAGEWLEGSGGTLEAMHGPLALPETGTYTVVLTGDGAQTGSIALGTHVPGTPIGALQGPVAAYSFDEGEEETVEDLSGDGHTATVHGATWTTHGKYGGAMELGGEGQYLSVPDSPQLDFTEEFTLEAWVRPDQPRKWAPVINKVTSGSRDEPYFLYEGGWAPDLPWGGVENNNEEEYVNAKEPLSENAWSHLALTYDGSKVRLYVDGELVDEAAGRRPVVSDGELQIGRDTDGNFLEGRIDEVRIYDRALGAAEVGLDMETPLATPKTGPVAAWSFDEGAGTTATDLTGHGHTATLSKATWTKGRFGDGLKFDGKKSCVTVAGSAELNFTEELTLEAWVRPLGSKEEGDPLIVQTDEAAGPGEMGYAYDFLAGENEVPKAWVRKAGSGYSGVYGAEPLPRNKWSHVALTDDGAHLRLYVDGELVRTEPAPTLTTGTGPLHIGCDIWNGHFNGRIDEVRMYNRALNAGEVDGDMEAPVQTPKTGPIAAYSFDQGSGETVEDLTGDGHTATLEGAGWTPHGKYGGAVEFDAAEEDFVSIPASTALDGSEELTIEAWVRPDASPSWGSILMKEREGSGPLYSYALLQRGDRSEGRFQDGSEGKLDSPEGSLPSEVWTHLAITDDGYVSRLYVDGRLVDTEPARPIEGHGEIRLGGNSPWGSWFDGRIDELRIYDRGLDAAELGADTETPLQTSKTGPVATYSFDEGQGETVTDVTGHGHTAAIHGAEWTTHGKYGPAIEFDASNGDYLSVSDSPELDFTEEFTLEAWVRPGPESGEYGPLITKQTTGSRAQPYFLYEGSWEPDVPYGGTNENTEEEAHARADDPLPTNTWSHLALTYDGRDVRLYVDGRLVDCEEASPPTSSEGDLEIGAAGEVESYFDGRVDEVRIYNRALGAAEVGTDMEAPIQTPQHGPIAAWSFDEGEGTTAEDVTGDGHEGTIEGAEWVRGKYGDALRFDGAGDVVKVPNSPEFALTEAFTLEAWVRPESESNRWAPILAKEMGGGQAITELAWWLYESDWEADEPYGGTEPAPGEENYAASDDPLPVGAWSHVALTWDGSKVRLYVDGELVDCSPIAPAGAPRVTEGEVQIGAATEHGDHFLGRIDEARIYNRALSASEVTTSMAPLPTIAQGETYEAEESNAVLTGIVDPKGLETAVSYEYGLTRSYGMTWPESADETEKWVVGKKPMEVEQVVEELVPGSTYHYRVIATNALGRMAGPDQTVTTSVAEPKAAALAGSHFSGLVGVQYDGRPFTSEGVGNRVVESEAQMYRIVIGAGSSTADKKLQRERNDELFEFMTAHHVHVLPDIVDIPGRGDNLLPPIGTQSAAGRENRKLWADELKGTGHPVRAWGRLLAGIRKKHGASTEAYAPVFWEIWNEENVEVNSSAPSKEIDPQRYGALLALSHEVFEEVDKINNKEEEAAKELKILFGGLLTVGKTYKKPHETEMAIGQFIREAGHSKDYDALSYHPYAYIGSVASVTGKVKKNIRLARRALNKYGGRGKKIWITEIGWAAESGELAPDPKHPPVSEATLAERLKSVFNMIKRNAGEESGEFDIKNLLWYNIQDLGGPKWEGHCGLYQADGQARSTLLSYFQEQVE